MKKPNAVEEPVVPVTASMEDGTAKSDIVEGPAEEVTETEGRPSKATAKAGKRSTKALKEAKEKEAKEERKTHAKEEPSEADANPKKVVKPTRSRLERRGRKFREAAKLIEKGKTYELAKALELAQKTSTAKFDASVELHINLNVDPRHADQNIRDSLVLPAGTGRSVRVAVFTDDAAVGADISGIEQLTKHFDKGELNFDVLIATPANMPKLGKYARILGPRGLMPNPKSGTVATDVAKAVKEAKAGRVEYRVDSTGIVHLAIGKVSFTPAQLLENAQTVLTSIKSNKPASIKGTYVKAIHVSTTMGPGVAVDTSAS